MARSFSPGSTVLPVHTGQSAPWLRENTAACHVCPWGHCHHTRRRLPGATAAGVSPPFLVGCHCRARAGYRVAKSFSPGLIRRPVQ